MEDLYFSNLTAHYNPIIFLIVLFRELLNSSLEASRAIFYYLAPSMEPVGGPLWRTSNLTGHYSPIMFCIVLFIKLLNSGLEASRAIFYYLAPSMEPIGGAIFL